MKSNYCITKTFYFLYVLIGSKKAQKVTKIQKKSKK